MSFGVIVCNGFDLLYLKICVIEIAWSASISKVSFEVIKVSVFMSWEEMRCSSHCIFVCLRSSLFAVCLPHPHPTGHFSILRCDFFFFLFSFCFSFVFAVLNGICEMVSYPACLPACLPYPPTCHNLDPPLNLPLRGRFVYMYALGWASYFFSGLMLFVLKERLLRNLLIKKKRLCDVYIIGNVMYRCIEWCFFLFRPLAHIVYLYAYGRLCLPSANPPPPPPQPRWFCTGRIFYFSILLW